MDTNSVPPVNLTASEMLVDQFWMEPNAREKNGKVYFFVVNGVRGVKLAAFYKALSF